MTAEPSNESEPGNPRMDEQVVIFIYGLPGAGKSTLLTIASEYNIPSVTMGDVVRERATAALGPDADSDAIGEWATQEREQYGYTIMAEYTMETVSELDADHVIVEGTRSRAEIEVFDAEPSFRTVTVRVDAPFSDRLHRLRDRGRDGEETFTAQDLMARDVREFSWGLGDLIASDSPDYVVSNDASLAEYQDRVRNVFESVTAT